MVYGASSGPHNDIGIYLGLCSISPQQENSLNPKQPSMLISGQFESTSPGLTLNGGLYKEEYLNGLKLGIDFF